MSAAVGIPGLLYIYLIYFILFLTDFITIKVVFTDAYLVYGSKYR